MSSADRRLDAVATGLTARERAIIAISYCNRDEQPDERLTKYMSSDQQEEFDRLVGTVQRAIDEFYSNCILWCEWTHQADITMAWLECLAASLARQTQMVAALKKQGIAVREATKATRRSPRPTLMLSPMRAPKRGFRRDVPLLLGTLVHEEAPPPEDWKGAIGALAASVREAVEVRWQELAATEEVLLEMSDAFGGDCCHRRLREALDAVRKKLLDLYEAVLPFVGSFSLPEPDQRFLEGTRSQVEWEALVSTDQTGTTVVLQDRRAWLSQNERAALEEIESRWKGEAQSLKPAPMLGVARDVPALPLGRRRKQRQPDRQ